MTLFKKLSLIIPVLLFAMNSIAQNNTESETRMNAVPIDPASFIENYLPANTQAKPAASAQEDLLKSRTINRETKKQEGFGEGMLSWVKDKYADVLEVLPSQISNVMLYRFIDEWYGVKYRMGGTSKKGIDCSAFVQTLYQYVFGFNLLRTAGMQFTESKYIKSISDLREGDLVFFRINTSRISHVGVYLKNNFFVHSASSKGVSIANLTSEYWNKYYAGGGRIIN
jgi:lipoprotein Spr